MKPPTAKLLTLMKAAAELRAGGASWATVAAKIDRCGETCRTWAYKYPATWNRLLNQAEDQHIQEGGGQARIKLRMLLLSGNEHIALEAARILTKARADQRTRWENRPKKTLPKGITEKELLSIREAESMSDDELEEVCAQSYRALARLQAEAQSAPALDPPPAPPAAALGYEGPEGGYDR